MKNKKNFWVIGVGLLVAVAFLIPAMAQEKCPVEMGKVGKIAATAKAHSKEAMKEYMKKKREKLVAELKLSPDKTKEFMALSDKFRQQRKEIIGKIKQNEADLKKAMAASPPDEEKVKSLVEEIVANQEKYFDTFKEQSKESMALMTPIQQGKYVLILMKWHDMDYEHMKKEK